MLVGRDAILHKTNDASDIIETSANLSGYSEVTVDNKKFAIISNDHHDFSKQFLASYMFSLTNDADLRDAILAGDYTDDFKASEAASLLASYASQGKSGVTQYEHNLQEDNSRVAYFPFFLPIPVSR